MWEQVICFCDFRLIITKCIIPLCFIELAWNLLSVFPSVIFAMYVDIRGLVMTSSKRGVKQYCV
jgi:hypothetical protein